MHVKAIHQLVWSGLYLICIEKREGTHTCRYTAKWIFFASHHLHTEPMKIICEIIKYPLTWIIPPIQCVDWNFFGFAFEFESLSFNVEYCTRSLIITRAIVHSWGTNKLMGNLYSKSVYYCPHVEEVHCKIVLCFLSSIQWMEPMHYSSLQWKCVIDQ